MDSRTLRKIIAQLNEKNVANTRIQGYRYRIYEEENEVIAKAEGSGDAASSNIAFSDYAYTHGGSIFCEAVNQCHEIKEHLAQFREAEDSKIQKFTEDLEYNGQINRFFDDDLREYDLPCANAGIEREEKFYLLKWTKDGYECISEYN